MPSQLELEQLIGQVVEELKKLGMKESTIRSYKYSAYSPIRNFCTQHETTYYDQTILDAFLSSQKQRLDCYEISERHYRKMRRAILMLNDLAQYGVLQAGHYHVGSKYKTNAYFKHCLIQFLKSLHLGAGTITNIKSSILQFLSHIEHHGHSHFHTLSPRDVEYYLTVIAETHQGSMGNVVYALRLFLDYLKERSLVHKEFEPLLNSPVHRKKRILPYFTHTEVKTILNQIDIDTKEGKRDYAILILASYTGLRSIDIANLQLSDIDWVNETIHIVQRKTDAALLLPLETHASHAIAVYILEARPKSDSAFVFLSTNAPFRKLSDVQSIGNILKKYQKKRVSTGLVTVMVSMLFVAQWEHGCSKPAFL